MMRVTRNNAKNGVDLGDTLTEYFFKPENYKTWTKGILRQMDEKARREAGDTPLFMTEWNSMAVYSSPVHDEKYSAACRIFRHHQRRHRSGRCQRQIRDRSRRHLPGDRQLRCGGGQHQRRVHYR